MCLLTSFQSEREVMCLQINDFFTWQMLAGFSGATVCVAILTQFFKGLFDKLPFYVPTRAVSYLFALVLLFLTVYFTGQGGISEYCLCPVNAVLVSCASNGAFDIVKITVTEETDD